MRNTRPRLTALVIAAVMFCPSAVAAQRRRQRPAPKPRAETQAPARTTSAPAGADAAPARDARAADDRPLEELIPSDGYGVYVEVRRLGSILDISEIKMALGAARLFGTGDEKEFLDFADFITAHAELLGEARLSVAALPARPGIPAVAVGLRLDSPEAAAAFEPKYRTFLNTKAPAPQAPPARGRGARAAAPKAEAPFTTRRFGRSLVTVDGTRYNFRRLLPEGAQSLAGSPRFQSLRNRFPSEQLFVYLDVEQSQQGWMLMAHQGQPGPATEVAHVESGVMVPGPDSESGATVVNLGTSVTMAEDVRGLPPPDEVRVEAAPPEAGPTPEALPLPEEASTERSAGEGGGTLSGARAEPEVVSEEQLAVGRMTGLLSNIWRGIPRLPGAAAAAVGLEAGTLAVRVAVENNSGGNVSLIPFLPNVVSGPAITSEAAQVAPADGDVFISGSLDWQQMFNSMMGTAASYEVVGGLSGGAGVVMGGEPNADANARDEKPPTAEQTLAAVEKFLGFKFKEDFLPAFGHEVAVSFPLKGFTGGMRLNRERGKEEKKDAEPGFLVFVGLNDPDKASKLLPRALAALGMAPLVSQGPPEKREGFEIKRAGGFSYAVIGNFLVLGETEQVRHAADKYAARDTLANRNGYRDATDWQARQRLLHAYVSDELMRTTTEDTKKLASGSTDPAVLALLAQLEATPEAASFASTNEGEVLLHELRVPLNLLKVFGTAALIGVKEAPVIGHEMSAAIMLSNVRGAQEMFRDKRKMKDGDARFGTLEELLAEELLDKGNVERSEYKLELNALGDRFEATATPKEYGKTGRRSFFLDETGVIRAADHKGKPATAQDPPID